MGIQTYTARLIYTNKLTPDVYQLAFELPPDQKIIFEAGQYMIMFVPQEGAMPLRKLYSIASPSYQTGAFDLLVKTIEGGRASEFVARLKEGETVMFQGPAGRFVLEKNNRPKMFLCTGTGIAPIRSMILTQLYKGLATDYYLFWGIRRREDMFLDDEWEILAERDEHFHFMVCASREHESPTKSSVPRRIDQHVQEKLLELQKAGRDLNEFDYYICGGVPVIDGFRQQLLDLKVDTSHIYFEKFI